MTITVRTHLRRLIRSEYRKLSSTNTCWIFSGSVLVTTVLALLYNIGKANAFLNHGAYPNKSRIPADVLVPYVANIVTSGQFFGFLLVMLLAISMMTNEGY